MSDWLKRQAEEAAKRTDEKYGAGAYGGTAWFQQKSEEASNRKETQNTSPNSGGGDWLTTQAVAAAKRVDNEYGENAYGSTSWLSIDKESGYRNWIDTFNAFTERMRSDYSSRAGKYQSKDAMSDYRFNTSQEVRTLRSRADMYRNYFENNRDAYDRKYGEGATDEALAYLSKSESYFDSLLGDLNKEYNYWKNFESEDDYNKYVEDSKEYERLSNYDLDAARKELEALEAQLEEAEEVRNNSYLRIDMTNVGADAQNYRTETIQEAQRQYNELNDRAATLRQDIFNAEKVQKGNNYATLMESPDFETYSKQGAAIQNPTMQDAEKGVTIFGWNPWAEEIGNIVTYSRDNLDMIRVYEAQGEPVNGKSLYAYMKDEEVSIYNYLLAKEGEKSAQEYLDYIEETLNARSGAEGAAWVQGIENPIGSFLAHGLYSVAGGLDQFFTGTKQLFSEERIPTSPIQFTNQELAEDLDGLGYYAFQAGTTVGNMLPSIAVTALTGGLGASAGVASTVGAATVGLSAGGNAYNQALAEGYSTEQARDYGIAVGASEALLERLIGGVGSKLGIGEEVLLSKVGMIDNAFARIALTGTVKLGAEITEEELQLVLEPAFRTIIFGEDYKLPEVKEILETALITAISTGVLEGGSIVSAGKTPQTDITATPEAPTQDGLPAYEHAEPMQNPVQDNATPLQSDDLALGEETPTQTETTLRTDESTTDSVEARATEAAYEAGKANIPRENITLETTAQEEAYNNGRIEYIKSTAKPTEVAQQNAEAAPSIEQKAPKGAAAKVAVNTAMVQEAAASLGENGAKALAYVYTPEIAAQYSPTKVAVSFAKIYNATLEGKSIDGDLAAEVKGLPETIRMAAIDSAKNDALIAKQAKYFGADAKLVKDNNWKMAHLSSKDTRKLDALAKVLGVQIRFAPKVADGAANAQYIRGANGGIIELALDGNDPFMTSAVHEAIHRIREASPELYSELSEFVRHNMGQDSRYMAMGERSLRYQTDNVSDITEEMVADAFGRMMNDSEVLTKLAGEHRTVVQRIMDSIRDMINAVKRALNGQNVELTENQKAEFRDLQDKLTEMEKVFRTALKESEVKAEQRKTTTTRDGVLTRTTDADGTTVLTTANDNPVAQMDEDGSALFSLKTYEAFGRAELKRWLDLRVSKNLLSKEDAADIVKQLDEYYDLCQQFKNKYAPFGAWSEASVVTDNKGKPVFSVVKANGEYAMNLDFSLVCKKRRTLDAVFGEMIKRDVMNFVTLEEADIVKINDIIRENGFETACALCFVDSKRYRQAKVTDSFVSQYNDIVRMLLPEGGDVKAHHFDFVESGHYKNGGTGLHTVSNAELADGINKLKQVMRENGSQTVAHKIAKHLLNHPSDRKLVDRSDFMNTDGFGAVKLKNPAVMKLYNSSKGSGGPKAAFSDVQYLGEILSKKGFTAQKAYLVGGVRIQSFSDYIPRLVFDYLQMVGDLAAKKLPAHAYTKEATFVKQFGMTGIKMNMSLVPDVSKSGVAPGLDENGNYIWKDGQSFGSDVAIKGSGQTGYELAIEIQNAEGYSKHCGTIAVGVSKEHITKMLGDDNIRMIIPYHKSSLNHIVAMLNNIDKFTDYTGVQNTRGADGKKISGKEFNFNEALIRLGDAKAAANEYLAWCQEHNYIPKFDEFAYHENYYKLLEDFATYDNGVASPQGAVAMTFPKEGDAFGSMTELIEQGLDEDAVLEGRRDKKLSSIVDQVEAALEKKGDKKYSLKDDRDKDYMTAIERGDTETAQRMVDEAAKAAGYDSPLLYHGTNAFGFTQIDLDSTGADGYSFWASNREDVSGTYAAYGKTRRIGEEITDEEIDGIVAEANEEMDDAIAHFRRLVDRTFSEWVFGQSDNSYLRKIVDEASAEMGDGDGVYDRLLDVVADAYYDYGEDVSEQYEDFAEWQEESEEFSNLEDAIVAIESLKSKIHNIERGEVLGGVYSLYGNTDNMYEVDAKGKAWNELHPEGLPQIKRGVYEDVPYKTRDVAKWAKDNGYSGVLFKNIKDNGQYGRTPPGDVYCFFNPQEQIKSADPVTYDDNGNVIPLSERFKAENNDIRYSLKTADVPVKQEISSARTSIMQIPALFKDKNVRWGKTNIDIGGGRFDLAKNYLAERGTKSMIFDPYNRGAQENGETLAFLQSGKKADTATCANVLNVIAEPAARSNVILEAAKAIKPNGTAYFMVYEGDGSGVGKQTSAGWQNNRKTADYVGEISEWFGNVQRKGKLIIASEPVKNLPKAAWEVQPGEAVMYSLKSREQLDEYIKHHGEIPKGEKPTREIHMPTKTKDNRKLSYTVRTVLEAGVTPDIAIPTIEDMVASGEFTHEVYTDKEAMADAKATIKSKGWALALSDWLDGVKRGEVSKQSTALGWTLYNNAVTSGDIDTSMIILSAMVGHQRDAAQALQAQQILKKLSPEGQLYQVVKNVERLQAEIDERHGKGKRKGKGKGKNKGQNSEGRVDPANVPVEEWMQKTGEILADKLAKATKAPTEKAKTTVDIILDDLWRVAREKVTKPTRQTTKRTNMEVIEDLFNNQEEFQRAWDAAKQTIEEQYGENPEVMAALEEWRESALDYNEMFTKEVAGEFSKRYGVELKVDRDLAEQFLQATTQEERDKILKEIYRDIGRQVPATFMDKWNAWRYSAMLGNIRTHVRNMLGNTFFMPVVFAKDMTATAIESAVSRVTKGGIQRTKQYGSLTTKRGREILKAAWADFDKVKESMGDAKYIESVNANRYIEEGRRIFKFKPLEKLRKGNSNLLESEDTLASRPHYAYAMAQYCLANNITAEQIAKGKAILPARTYAMNEAKKATYRDVNAFSQMVSGWGRSDGKSGVKKVGSAIVEGILPFRRTPANILVRGLEYSPAGLLKSLTVDLWKVKNGEKTAAEAIDNISAGLTGTGLVGLGVLLAAEGLLRGHGGDDEEENKFDELMGHQAYALELPGGKSVTLDWLAPEVLPLFIGVNLWEMAGAEDEKVTLSTILGAVSNVTEPLLEMSCLQSLNDVFDSVGYASSEGLDALPAALASAATSYLTQAFPTLMGQGERSAQEDRMTTYTEKNAFLTGDMQYLLGGISAKVPGWDFNQIPYIDAWGRKETNGNTLERIGNNFLNPAYTSDVAMSDMEAELLRLYEQTGEANVFPERADKYFTVDGERIDLTAEQYVKYATVKGQTSHEMITDLVTSKEYKTLTDAEKVKAIAEVYGMANEKAKAAVSNYKPTSNKADIDPSSYAVYEAHKATAREDGKLEQGEVFDIIESMLDNGLSDDDGWSLYLDEYTPTSKTAASGYNADGTMNAIGVRDAGVDIETWLEFKDNLNNLEYESGKQGARKAAFEEMLEEMGIDDETYAILFGTEYKPGGSSGGTFGGGAFGGGSMFGE